MTWFQQPLHTANRYVYTRFLDHRKDTVEGNKENIEEVKGEFYYNEG